MFEFALVTYGIVLFTVLMLIAQRALVQHMFDRAIEMQRGMIEEINRLDDEGEEDPLSYY